MTAAPQAEILAFVTEVAGMATDAERQEDTDGEIDPEVRAEDTATLDALILRARGITGAGGDIGRNWR
jgi:hypothetical protein